MEALAQIAGLTVPAFWSAFAVFLRVGSAMIVLPAIGSTMIPMRIRFAAAIALTIVVSSGLPPGATPNYPPTPPFILAEISTGVFLGLLIRLLAMALQIAGSVAAQSTSLAQIFGGAGADPQPAIGFVLSLGGLTLAVIAGFHLKLVTYFITSYGLVPSGAFIGPGTLARIGTERAAYTFGLGLTLAAPFVLAALLYNVTLGVINKAMPQLMVSFVGAPAITAAGLGLLALTAPAIIAHWHDALVATGFGAHTP